MTGGFRGRLLGTIGAALLCLGHATTPAHAIDPTETETASFEEGDAAIASSVNLPRLLTDQDRTLYRKIFAVQKDGHWREADKLIDRLGDPILMGHVLFQRYMHPTAWRSKYTELKDWMDEYGDLPGAERVYQLALKRRPKNYRYPSPPHITAIPGDLLALQEDGIDDEKSSTHDRSYRRTTRSGRAVVRQVRHWVQGGYVTRSLEYIRSEKISARMDPGSRDEAYGLIARGYYRYDKDKEAIEVADIAFQKNGADAPKAMWWGGLSAWRSGDYAKAGKFFETLSGSKFADRWERAAGSFWASRAFLVSGKPEKVNPMLEHAASFPRTFYGLLAIRALNIDPPFDWNLPGTAGVSVKSLMRIPAAKRAVALLEVGQRRRAEEEMKRFVGKLPPKMAGVALAFADAIGMADVAYQVGANLRKDAGMQVDAALYPIPGYQPEGGFDIDRALLFGFMRQESRFRPMAKSPSGARGLMQLMPATASWLSGTRYSGSKRSELLDPALNLSLGQKYIQYLLDEPDIGGNLFYAAAAYNAGPGNLAKWRNKIQYRGDPLLFIESIPSLETRLYMEHVMSNLWIYRHRLGQEAPSMDALLAGRWPVYIGLDIRPVAAAPIAVEEK